MNTKTYDEYVRFHNDRRERIIARNKARRAKELKRNVLTFVFTFILVLGLSIAFGGFLANAQSNDEPSEVKCFSSIMIGYGETLEDVIESNYDSTHYSSFSDFKSEVYAINSLDDSSSITPGNCVVMPYYTILASN